MGTVVFAWDAMDEVAHLLAQAFSEEPRECYLPLANADRPERRQGSMGPGIGTRGRRDISARVRDAVVALATCHNVSVVYLNLMADFPGDACHK